MKKDQNSYVAIYNMIHGIKVGQKSESLASPDLSRQNKYIYMVSESLKSSYQVVRKVKSFAKRLKHDKHYMVITNWHL